jgi:membrane-bound lytic murein transglycosylase D
LKGWNKTRRDAVMPGQVLVLHVPVGKAMPSEPGPERLATNVSGGGVERIGTAVADTGKKTRYDKKHGRERAEVVKVSDPVKAKSPSAAPSKASKGTASRQKAVAQTQKQQKQKSK